MSTSPSSTLQLLHDVTLAPLTTIGLGGRARYFAECGTEATIQECLTFSSEHRLPLQVLGGGSNIIFPDAGFNGVVLHVGIRGVLFVTESDTVIAEAGAGETWDPFVQACIEAGYAGIECLSGIPGSVGGTPVQNVGAYGQEVADTVDCVHAIDRETGQMVSFTAAECGFGYRQSRFKSADADRFIITRVAFRLQPGGAPTIRYPELRAHVDATAPAGLSAGGPGALAAVRDAVIALRRKKSMVYDPADPYARSAGSFFTNPLLTPQEFERTKERWGRPEQPIPTYQSGDRVKIPAAWLVENAGYRKGYRKGGVGISANHSLALVNLGGTSDDLLTFAEEIRHGVLETFDISLEREPIVVNERGAV